MVSTKQVKNIFKQQNQMQDALLSKIYTLFRHINFNPQNKGLRLQKTKQDHSNSVQLLNEFARQFKRKLRASTP